MRPIENYISPPQLFPEDSTLRAPYLPLPAFDHPNGKVIGKVIAELTPCPPQSGASACAIPQAWYLQLAGGHRVELHHEMVGYDREALVSYKPTLFNKGTAWSNIEYDGGAFWTRTAAADVSNYESLATWPQNFETWCSQPAKCSPLSATMRKELARVAAGEFELRSIGQQAYEIKGIVTYGGRRYYKLALAASEAGSPKPALPKKGYIPTRARNGRHTGDFSPKGC